MSDSKLSPEELRAESSRLGALMRKRSEGALKAVAEMSKHPCSLEQAKEQAQRNREKQRALEKERLLEDDAKSSGG